MKKILFTLLTILMVIVSCAKIDIVSDTQNSRNENMEITFSTNVGHTPMTKSIVDKLEDFNNAEFGVYGYVRESTTNKYLINKGHYKVDDTIASATNGEAYYWPKADNNNTYNVDFLAIYPYNATYSRTVDTVKVTLNANNVGTESVDVMYAITNGAHHQEVNKLDNSDPNKYMPKLKFKHALSLVEFQGKHAGKKNNIDTITVTEIAFLDGSGNPYQVITGGTLSFTENNGWTADTTKVTGTTYNAGLNFGNNVGIDSIKYTTISKSILVPQSVPNRVRITYDITITNNTGETIKFTGRQVVKEINTGSDMTNNTPKSYATNWYSGKHYIYKYYITAEAIEFTVTVDDWGLPNGWQIWDHDVTSYVDRFFEKASTIMGNCIEVQNHIMA